MYYYTFKSLLIISIIIIFILFIKVTVLVAGKNIGAAATSAASVDKVTSVCTLDDDVFSSYVSAEGKI